MFSKFLNLSQEKQDRIINAAIKEFAQKGYEKASTNEIVKEAEISKGLLFHYFQNKKQLFLFLYDYCVEVTTNELFSKIKMDEQDLFIKLRQGLVVKLELSKKYPEIIRFIEAANMEESSEVKSDLVDKNKKITISSYGKLFENIDTSKFKENIDIQRAINIMSWTFQGYSEQTLNMAKKSNFSPIDYEKILSEADVYIEILKNCFYK